MHWNHCCAGRSGHPRIPAARWKQAIVHPPGRHCDNSQHGNFCTVVRTGLRPGPQTEHALSAAAHVSMRQAPYCCNVWLFTCNAFNHSCTAASPCSWERFHACWSALLTAWLCHAAGTMPRRELGSSRLSLSGPLMANCWGMHAVHNCHFTYQVLFAVVCHISHPSTDFMPLAQCVFLDECVHEIFALRSLPQAAPGWKYPERTIALCAGEINAAV